MRILTLLMISSLAALTSAAADRDEGPRSAPDHVDWLAGYWLNCDAGGQTAEVWIGAGSGLLVGATHATGRDGTSFEHARIARQADGRLAFFASPGGAPAVAFTLTASDGQTATFENPGHDFPQRVTYSRSGDVLTGRIDGVIQGKSQSMEWRYTRARLGDTCPS